MCDCIGVRGRVKKIYDRIVYIRGIYRYIFYIDTLLSTFIIQDRHVRSSGVLFIAHDGKKTAPR